MSRDAKTKKASETIRAFLRANPTRVWLTIQEFHGEASRALRDGMDEPATPYNGAALDKAAVARVFQALQAEGVLGKPYWPKGMMRDRAYPRQFPVLRTPL